MNIVFAEELSLKRLPFIKETIERLNHKGLCIIGECGDKRYIRSLASDGILILGDGEKILKEFEITRGDKINFITDKPYQEIFKLLKNTDTDNLDFRIYNSDGTLLDIKKIIKSKIEDKPVLRTKIIGNDINLDSVNVGDYYTINNNGETFWELLSIELVPKIPESCRVKVGSFNLKTSKEDTKKVEKRLCSGSSSFIKYKTKQVVGSIKGDDKVFKRTTEVFDSIFVNEQVGDVEPSKLVKEILEWASLERPAPLLVLGKELQKTLFNIGISKKHMLVVEREMNV